VADTGDFVEFEFKGEAESAEEASHFSKSSSTDST
jgi:hypothetical protein